MLSRIAAYRLKLNRTVPFCTNAYNHDYRVAMENENHNGTGNERQSSLKYKTQGEHFLSTKSASERSTSSYVEKIEVLSPSNLVGSVNVSENLKDMSRDRLGQWPTESESEMSGQGLDRLRNGRFNKVSKINPINYAPKQKQKQSKQSMENRKEKVKNEQCQCRWRNCVSRLRCAYVRNGKSMTRMNRNRTIQKCNTTSDEQSQKFHIHREIS